MAYATVYHCVIDGSEFGWVAEKEADRKGQLVAIIPADNQFGGGVALKVSEQRLPEGVHRFGVHWGILP